MSKKFTISQRALGINDDEWAMLMAIVKPIISAYVMPEETKTAIAEAERQAKDDALIASIQFLREHKGRVEDWPTPRQGEIALAEAMEALKEE